MLAPHSYELENCSKGRWEVVRPIHAVCWNARFSVDYGVTLLSLRVPREISLFPSFPPPGSPLRDFSLSCKESSKVRPWSPETPWRKFIRGFTLCVIPWNCRQAISLTSQRELIRVSKASATPLTPPLIPHQPHRCSTMALQEAGSRWKKLCVVSGVFLVYRPHGSTVRSWASPPTRGHPLRSSHSCSLSRVPAALTCVPLNWASQEPWERPDWCRNYSALFQLQISLNRKEY